MPKTGSTAGGEGGLEKATIARLDAKGNIEKQIECKFRPKEYTVSKSNTWNMDRKEKETKGKNLPKAEFGGGQPATLTMELFFDTYESGDDVREKYTNDIWDLMMVDEKLKNPKTKKGEPPKCRFIWGNTMSFKAAITSISQKFTFFKPDGTPVRATLNVSFKQVEEGNVFPPQNPTTVSELGYKTRVVKEGETIDWIAYDEYGDPALWRLVADINGLEDPMRLKAGQALAIAPQS